MINSKDNPIIINIRKMANSFLKKNFLSDMNQKNMINANVKKPV